MRLRVVPQPRLAVSSLGLLLGVAIPIGAQEPREVSANLAVAESVILREEAASERAFDPAFRAKAKELLAALPLAALEAQTGENGLGLNSLGDSQADLVYTPVTPCRIIDTRLSVGGMLVPGFAQAFKAGGATTDLSSQGGSATGCGIPSGATAVAVNFGATQSAGPGNLRAYAWAASATPPTAAVLNFGNLAPVGLVTMPNASIVPICDPATATCTSDLLLQPLRSHLDRVRRQHELDLAGGCGSVALPDALEAKYASAPWEWGWQWVFPATRLYEDPATGRRRRHHVHETVVQREFAIAVRVSGIPKPATCHTLRHYLPFLTMSGGVGQQLMPVGRCSGARGRANDFTRHSPPVPTGC